MNERLFAQAFLRISEDYFAPDPIMLAQTEFDASQKNFDDQIAFAKSIQDSVSKRIKFQSIRSNPSSPLTPEALEENQATNCYGNTIITSELLEYYKIDHLIGFVDEHAFVWLYDYRSSRSFLLDSHPYLRVESTNAIIGKPPAEWQLYEGPLLEDIGVQPEKLIQNINNTDHRNKIKSAPWLGMNPLSDNYRGESGHTDYTLPMRVYPSLPGREILESFYNSRVHTHNGDVDRLAEEIADLDGVYPEVDPRNKLKIAKQALKLLLQSNPKKAVSGAWAIGNSLLKNDKTMASFVLPDTLRKVGVQANSQEEIQRAIDYYKAMSHGGGLRLAKILAAEEALRGRGDDNS